MRTRVCMHLCVLECQKKFFRVHRHLFLFSRAFSIVHCHFFMRVLARVRACVRKCLCISRSSRKDVHILCARAHVRVCKDVRELQWQSFDCLCVFVCVRSRARFSL